MTKILDNTTGAPIDISDTGVNIDNAVNYTIQPQDYLIWSASADIITEINAGNVVVNNGVKNLSAEAGIRYLQETLPIEAQSLGVTVNDVIKRINFSSGISVIDDGNGNITVLADQFGAALFDGCDPLFDDYDCANVELLGECG